MASLLLVGAILFLVVMLRNANKLRGDRGKKRSLEVTGRWPRGHLRVRSVQAEARAKGFSERMLAEVHRCVRCMAER
jgi:hypothetical protein